MTKRMTNKALRPVRGALTLAVLAAAMLVAACGDKKPAAASQTAAKVNKEEITVHQINFVLQQQRGLRPDQTDEASRQILERLIDQELSIQKAEELKIDRDPRVVQQLEAARRDVLARAYVERVGDAASKPTPDEIRKYYDENPALFKERRIYNFQEIQIEAPADKLPELNKRLSDAKDVNEFVEYLRKENYRFAGNQVVRAAEQLPLANLKSFAAMKDGQAVFSSSPNGAQVLVLAGSRMQPVDLQQATPAIEQFLLNERKRKVVDDDIQALRKAATIQYVGKFAEAASAAASAASGAKQ
jgi:EpsD family peptidyl-prolyl cis-trans isomerase